MAYNFSQLKEKTKDTREWLVKEYSGVRTGRAVPALLDAVRVNAYGASTPIGQVGSAGVEDARTLRVTVWDPSIIKDIEKAIVDADLGVSVSSDEKGVRVSFPELTAERREQLQKLIHDKQEQARITLRTERDRVWQDIQEKEKAGEISEDEKYRYKEEMESLITEANKKLEELAKNKETEIAG